MSGWGSALIALAIVGAHVGILPNFNSKTFFHRALLVFWALMAHGNFRVLLSQSQKAKAWSTGPTMIQFVGEVALSLLSAYCGIFARESHAHSH